MRSWPRGDTVCVIGEYIICISRVVDVGTGSVGIIGADIICISPRGMSKGWHFVRY